MIRQRLLISQSRLLPLSLMKLLKSTFVSVLTLVTLISRFVVLSFFRTVQVRRLELLFLLRAMQQTLQLQQVQKSSVPRILLLRFRAKVSLISTSLSQLPT